MLAGIQFCLFCRVCSAGICHCLTVSRAAQRSVYAPTFLPHLAKLECDVCVLSAALASAVVSVTVCESEFELADMHCARESESDSACVCVRL